MAGSAARLFHLVLAAVYLFPVAPGDSPSLVLAQAGMSTVPSAQLPRANEVVMPRVYVSLTPVPRGRSFEVAVVAAIRPGFHINSHQPSKENLIPTSLTAELPAGFRALDTDYPPGVLRKFKFAKEDISVYEGSVTLRLKLQAPPDAPLGPTKLPLLLRYQACNDELCLPPVKLPLTAEFQLAAATAAVRTLHPEIFEPAQKSGARASH